MSGHTPLPLEAPRPAAAPLRDVVVFPHGDPALRGRPKSIKALELAMEAERRIMLVAQKAAAKDEPSVETCSAGWVSTILQSCPTARWVGRRPAACPREIASMMAIPLTATTPSRASAARRHRVGAAPRRMQQFDQYVKPNKKIPPEILTSISSIDDSGRPPTRSLPICRSSRQQAGRA